MARFMFETGAIGRDQVKDTVVRSGLVPEYVEPMTDFIVRFQERLWRRRYIMSVATGYRRGVFDESRLRDEIRSAGYTEGVADWMINTENIRKEINVAVRKPEKYRLISISYAQDLYVHDDVDESWIQSYFADKGYDAEDVDLAVKVLDREKAEYLESLKPKPEKPPKPKEGILTISMVKDLFIHNDVDESWLRDYFASLHYDREEIDLAVKVLARIKAKAVAEEVSG